MILHLIGNDPKFPKLIKQKFEAADPGQHVYVIVKATPKQPENGGDDFIYVSAPQELARIVESRSDWEAIIINGMLARLAAFCNVLPLSLPIAYYLWGGEAYGAIMYRPDALYATETARAVLTLSKRVKFFASSLFGAMRRLRKECHYVAQKIDYALFPLEEEIKFFVEQGLLPKEVQYVKGRVGSGLDMSTEIFQEDQCGEGILVGNSADPSNNHLDAFRWLHQQPFTSGRRVVVPLNYGGNEKYKQVVLAAGKEYFGELFYPILDFMQYNAYISLLKSCDVVVMNHLRQQGLGNIFMALAFGTTVYLQSSTTVSKELSKQGFAFMEISVHSVICGDGNSGLIDQCQRRENMDLCRTLFRAGMSINETREILEKLRGIN
tara:strand:+ start:507 stop:1646 length:1140 start_codon:yes stop_codon:yes gene_type:complete